MKTRKVKPYGMLYSQNREYFLLKPFPLESDSWEWEGEHRQAFRFVVVPRKVISLMTDLEIWSLHHPISPTYPDQFDEDGNARDFQERELLRAKRQTEPNIYPHARHIVTTSFNLEYADMPEITIAELEVDLSDYELDFKTNKEECKYE